MAEGHRAAHPAHALSMPSASSCFTRPRCAGWERALDCRNASSWKVRVPEGFILGFAAVRAREVSAAPPRSKVSPKDRYGQPSAPGGRRLRLRFQRQAMLRVRHPRYRKFFGCPVASTHGLPISGTTEALMASRHHPNTLRSIHGCFPEEDGACLPLRNLRYKSGANSFRMFPAMSTPS